MSLKRILQSLMIALFFNLSAFPQNIDDLVSRYSAANGSGYMQPLADVFGASFNSGLFHSAHIKKMGFQLYLGIEGSAAFIPDKRKTFMATSEGNFSPVQTVSAPTVLGSVNPVDVTGTGGTVYTFPGGLDFKMVPFAVPQLTLGSVFGTDVTFRYFGLSTGKDIGKISLFSFGVRHSISQYIPKIPLDLAVGFYKQQFNLGDIVKTNTWVVNAQASKRVLIFTFYGGLGYENSKMDISYTKKDDDTQVNFSLTGSNKIRFTGGVTFNLGSTKLNVDYNLASQSVLSVGLGIGIGE